MPSYKTTFGNFLRAEDLADRAVPVTISEVGLVTIKGRDGKPDERKLAAHFAGKDKILILNRTRCEQLEALFGSEDYESWSGPAMLVPGTTKFGGKTVPCIDIKPRMSAAARPKPAPEPEELAGTHAAPVSDVTDDDIPF